MSGTHTDILIAGGGLAGLSAAIHLAREGHSVQVIEKEDYPHHKVCGEYVSNEILPYLHWLGIYPENHGAIPVSHLQFSGITGKSLYTALPLGGFGLSRYTFDHLLFTAAKEQGAAVSRDIIIDIKCKGDLYEVETRSGNQYTAKVLLGAFGKRSSLDIKLSRSFIGRRSPWMAVKGHYKGTHPDHVVGLYSFPGGYCGVSRVENDIINICYLVHTQSFQQYKDIEAMQEKVLYRNRHLKKVFLEAEPLFERPLTISQVSFDKKPCLEHGILMTGDSAGLINPLCGNGMAMAIHSAQIASSLTIAHLNGKLTRAAMEHSYQQQWTQHFSDRLRTGSRIAALLRHEHLSGMLTRVVAAMPWVLPAIIRKTHGRPVTITENIAGYAE